MRQLKPVANDEANRQSGRHGKSLRFLRGTDEPWRDFGLVFCRELAVCIALRSSKQNMLSVLVACCQNCQRVELHVKAGFDEIPATATRFAA